MKAHTKKCRKMVKFFRKFEKIQDFFDFFEVFYRKTFLYSELQSSAYHHKIPRKNRHRTVHTGVDGGKIVLYQKPSENAILRGLKLRRLTRNQINLH